MGFDWFTLAAQLVNFGLLLVLLRVFLYRPVLGVMQRREERLARAWEEAERVRAEARAQAERLAERQAQLERDRRARLERLEADLEQLRSRRLEQVEEEVAAHRARRLAALQDGHRKAVDQLRERSARLLVDELRASLADLADEELEERVGAVFARRLGELDGAQLTALREAAARHVPVLTTAFPLPDAQVARLTELVTRVLRGRHPPRFVTDERLLFGIELTVGALRVGVSGSQRLAALETAFGTALTELGAGREAVGRDGIR